MNKLTEQEASPVFGLRYLEDREVEGLDVVGCLAIGRWRRQRHGDRLRRHRPRPGPARPVAEACRRRAPAARHATSSPVDESNGQ